MKRREFITLLGGAVAASPLAARGQQPVEVPRVGFVYSGPKAAMAPRMGSILTGLQASGYAAAAQVEIVPNSRKATRIRSVLW
jgi:putative ABC transport system substrate-binding protein